MAGKLTLATVNCGSYSVEKLFARVRPKNRSALESLEFPRFEGTANLDDLRPPSFTVSRTSCFPHVFDCISIKLKNRVRAEREFFNRIGPKADDHSVHWHRIRPSPRGARAR